MTADNTNASRRSSREESERLMKWIRYSLDHQNESPFACSEAFQKRTKTALCFFGTSPTREGCTTPWEVVLTALFESFYKQPGE